MQEFKIFSTFTGIGGFEIGIQNAADSFNNRPNLWDGVTPLPENGTNIAERALRVTCVGYSEIDKYATAVYEKQFKGVRNYGDITKINAENLPDFDCLVGGFPCQAFSIAGKRHGFEDTRGTLFFDLARILRAKQPRLFVFENVKGLLNHANGSTFKTIVATIDELGYDCQWQVLNSKNHGVPQNRERIIIVGHIRNETRPQVFPISGTDNQDIRAVGQGISNTLTGRSAGNSNWRGNLVRVGTLRTHKDGNGFREMKSGLAPTIPARARNDGSGQPVIMQKARGKNKGNNHEIAPTITGKSYQDNNHLAIPVLTPDRANKRQNGRRMKTDGEPAFTVTAIDRHGIYNGTQVRRLTPMECERLQAFPDNWTKYGMVPCTTPNCERCALLPASDEHMVQVEISDTQRYKMCGNAVTTNVIEDVFNRIFATI